MKQELKLEVGKKYNFIKGQPLTGYWAAAINPCIYIYENDEFFYFIDAAKVPFPIKKSIILGKIKEHREPFKNTVEGWIGCDDDLALDKRDIIDILVNKYCTRELFETRERAEYAMRDCTETMRVRITLEELPETNED